MTGGGPRILMTTDAVGGVLGYSLDLCRAIADRGGEVLLVQLGPRAAGVLLEEAVAQMQRVKLLVTDYKLEWMDDASDDVERSAELLLSLEREFRPDVVHLNGYALGAVPFRAPKLVVAHSCVLSWWRAVHGQPAPAKYDAYRNAVARGLRGADAVTAPSAAMLSELRVHYDADFRGLVIHNASLAAPVAEPERRDGVLCAGRLWDPAKNLELMLAAARGLPCKVRLAGSLSDPSRDAPGRASLPELTENVELLGVLSRSEMAQRFRESAVYAHPARYEPFGLSVLEAAQAGCALVLSDIPSLRELWQDAALFVPVGDADALRTTLLRLERDAALCASWAARARRHAQRYGFQRFGLRYLSLYAELQDARQSQAADELGSGAPPQSRPQEASRISRHLV